MSTEQLFQLRTSGHALKWTHVYEPFRFQFDKHARFSVVCDAEHTDAHGLEEFERKGFFHAKSIYRPSVTPLRHPIRSLVEILQEYDATNIARDVFFRECREVVVNVNVYPYNLHGREGRALGLRSLEIDW